MLGSADLIAFVATTQLERARAFYQGVLGLALVAEDPFALTVIEDKDYGGRGYGCLDPEGNVWSFGTYDPWGD